MKIKLHTRYRIVDNTRANGEHFYHVQYKRFLFWHHCGGTLHGIPVYESMIDAKGALHDYITQKEQKKKEREGRKIVHVQYFDYEKL